MSAMDLLGDYYFLAGAVLFLASLWGAASLLKSLGNRFPPPAPPAEPQPRGPAPLEDTSRRLDRIEESLIDIKTALARSRTGSPEGPAAGPGSPAGGTSSSQIASKIDRIYEVLASLSGSSGG